jgi:adenine-specific DNA-methyltransferase
MKHEYMQQRELESAVKLRGGYYTPSIISDFIVEWGFDLQSQSMNILEPSCGDGSFIQSVSRHLSNSASNKKDISLLGVEFDDLESEKARKRLNKMKKKFGCKGKIINDDYFDYMLNTNDIIAKRKFDLILGNPPYIRYQYFEHGKSIAEKNFDELGIKTTKHANSWLYFVADCVSKMSDYSRIGLVIPAELLHISYAKGLRKWLSETLDITVIVTFEELVFPNVQQEVVILLGEKNPEAKGKIMKVLQKKNLAALNQEVWNETNLQAPKVIGENDKWNIYFLNQEDYSSYQKASKNSSIVAFGDVADVRIGIVTGANKFFCIDDQKLKSLGLTKGRNNGLNVLKVMGRSSEVTGLEFNEKDYGENCKKGKSTNMLYFDKEFKHEKLSKKIKSYIRSGENQEPPLHTRYKCRIRKPWYWIPYVESYDIAMFKRASKFSRLILNQVNAFTTDTVHRISILKPDLITPKHLCFSFINSLTFLSCELEGRNYGGGVLELVPGEIRKLKMPIYQCTDEEFSKLDLMFRNGTDIEQILDYTDSILLKFLSQKTRKSIRKSWNKLQMRRSVRSKS